MYLKSTCMLVKCVHANICSVMLVIFGNEAYTFQGRTKDQQVKNGNIIFDIANTF